MDESIFFLEMLSEFNPNHTEKIATLAKEGNELLAIIVTSIKTAKNNA